MRLTLCLTQEAGLNVGSLKALLRECGEGGCAQDVADMLELHALMARRVTGDELDVLCWSSL